MASNKDIPLDYVRLRTPRQATLAAPGKLAERDIGDTKETGSPNSGEMKSMAVSTLAHAKPVTGKISLPPMWKSMIYRSKLQYTSSGAAAGISMTRGALGNSIGGVAISTTQICGIATSFRLRAVRVWPGVGGDAAVEWVANGNEQEFTRDSGSSRAVPTGITETGCFSFRPPKGAWASFWQNANQGTAELFALYCTDGSVIEVDLEWTLSLQQNGYLQTFTGLVAGDFYYPHLDGSGKKFTPIPPLNHP